LNHGGNDADCVFARGDHRDINPGRSARLVHQTIQPSDPPGGISDARSAASASAARRALVATTLVTHRRV
jgi:hypothetical protein